MEVYKAETTNKFRSGLDFLKKRGGLYSCLSPILCLTYLKKYASLPSKPEGLFL